MKKTKRIFSMLLALVMVLGLIGASGITLSAEDSAATSTVEAKWGASKDDLTAGSGTLAEAITAATATDSTVKYIRLQKDVSATAQYSVNAKADFTLDLNGWNVTTESYSFVISHADAVVRFTNSNTSKTGTVTSDSITISVFSGQVYVDSGNYSGTRCIAIQGGSVEISGGTFTATDTSGYGASCISGSLTVSDGTFNVGSARAAVYVASDVTVTGGTFSAGSWGTFYYTGGKLNLSGYPTADTTGTTPITQIQVKNYSGAAVTPGENTISIPTGYCFYDKDNNAVSSLANVSAYTIGVATATTVEAMWGTSKDDLTAGSGTLADAVKSSAAYVQLQNDVTSTTAFWIDNGGEMTIDLNGKNVTFSGETTAFFIRNNSKVTFTDSADEDGTVKTAYSAINISNAEVIIDGGKYEGENDQTVYVESTGTATINGGEFTVSASSRCDTVFNTGTLVITGGTFINNCETYSPVATNSSTTIKGGSFTDDENNDGIIRYDGGSLDLSEYPTTETDGTTQNTQ